MKIVAIKTAPLAFRAGHWLLAVSVAGLLLTGIVIYTAAPFWGDIVPNPLPASVGLTEALRWHLMLPWFLLLGLILVTLKRLTGKPTLPALVPVSPVGLWGELKAMLRFQLHHQDGRYLEIQKVVYLGVFSGLAFMFLTGFCLWKPVQLQHLTHLLGGYENCRRLHFLGLAAFAFFLAVHVVMALATPRILAGMICGWKPQPGDRK